MKRITIIGTGAVGSAIAWTLAIHKSAAEIILIDQIHPLAEGEAMDMQNAVPLISTVTIRTGSYTDCADADCIIITAGRSRHEGESRNDLLEGNRSIMLNILDKLAPHYKGCYLIIVSNPVDALTYLAANYFKNYSTKIIGTGTLLDSARLRVTLAEYLHVSPGDISAYVIGEHGEHQMPLWNMTTVEQLPIDEYCEMHRIPWDMEIKSRFSLQIRNMGREIISKKGKTQYGISACVANLVKYLSVAKKAPICLSHRLENQYGFKNAAISLPVSITETGIEEFHFSFGEQKSEWRNIASAIQEQFVDL